MSNMTTASESIDEKVALIDLEDTDEDTMEMEENEDAAEKPAAQLMAVTGAGQFSMFPDVPLSTTGAKDQQKSLSKTAVKTPAAPVWNAESTYSLPLSVELYGRNYTLNEENFLGLKEVKGTEILNFMKDAFNIQVLREVKRVSFVYEKEDNLLFLLVKSPPNGCDLPMGKDVKSADGNFISLRRPVGIFTKPLNGKIGGSFSFHLPKIPMRIFKEAVQFFTAAVDAFGTEATARILYRPETGYELFIPNQKAARSRVLDMEQTKYARLTVIDIHSHGVHEAYISPYDERAYANRIELIGIIGPRHEGSVIFAAIYDGFEIPLEMSDLFEDDGTVPAAFDPALLDRLTVVQTITEEDIYNA